MIMPQSGALSTQEVLVDNPTSARSFDNRTFQAIPMANSIALDLAKHFPSIRVIRPMRYPKAITDAIGCANLVFSPDAINGNHVELELKVTSWNPGSAFNRFLTSGVSNSGEATLSVEAAVIRVSQGGVKRPVARSVFTTASTGNLLVTGTAGAPWTRAADEIAKWLEAQL
jgi:hypothetical protein